MFHFVVSRKKNLSSLSGEGIAMEDHTHLDAKYFIDPYIYNCPFCNRRHVTYVVDSKTAFDWTNEKKCLAIFVKCNSCKNTSLHLSFNQPVRERLFMNSRSCKSASAKTMTKESRS